jgi:D-tyrosyl-tRNA(Tyr) deacylase
VETRCEDDQWGDSLWCVMVSNAVRSKSDVAAVSQFTLLANTKKGSKPDFHGALGGDQAKDLYQIFVSKVQQGYDANRVKDGVFQAMMVSDLDLIDAPLRYQLI